MTERIAPTFALGFLSGVALAHGAPFGATLPLLLLVIGIGLFVCAMMIREKRERARVFLSAICILGAMLGALRFVSDDRPAPRLLQDAVGHAVILEGVISKDPDLRTSTAALVVSVDRVHEGDASYPVDTLVRVNVPRYPEYSYGERVRIKGALAYPEAFSDDDTGRVIAYDRMLRSENIRFVVRASDITRLGDSEGNWYAGQLYAFKRHLLSRGALVIDEPAFSLLAGVTLGEKSGLGDAWTERFQRTGLSHIVVLSGYNMAIVSDWVGKALAAAGPFARALGGTVAIVSFAIMAGGGAATVRAAIMAAIILFARAHGRERVATRALLYAAGAMVLVSPRILLDDLGFQLSFLATLGLIHGAPIIERHLGWVRIRWIREIAATTLAAQIAVLPLLLGKIGILSLIAPIANIAVLPLIPFAMAATFVTVMLALLVLPLAAIPAFIATMIAESVLFLVSICAQVPFAAIAIPPISNTIVLAAYAFLGWLVFRRGYRGALSERPPAISASTSSELQ